MPDTYTKEQIHDIATALYGWTALPRILPSAPGTGPDWDIGADIRAILSALSTAERECGALKARCAELEARIQGTADDETGQARDSGAWWWVQKIRARNPSHRNSWRWSNKDAARRLDEYFKELLSTAAIVGKKEGV